MNEPVATPHKTSETKLRSSKKWKDEHREEWLAYNMERNRIIAADPVLKAKKRESNRLSNQRNYEKRKLYDQQRDKQKVFARNKLRDYIAKGHIKRLPCVKCGDPNSHGHHEDYSKPFDVIWLCPKHHMEIHHV